MLGDDGGVIFSRALSMFSPEVGVDAAGGDPGRMTAAGAVMVSSRSTEVEVTSPLPNRTSMMNGTKACEDSSSPLKRIICYQIRKIYFNLCLACLSPYTVKQ